jgi:hypothetical protein
MADNLKDVGRVLNSCSIALLSNGHVATSRVENLAKFHPGNLSQSMRISSFPQTDKIWHFRYKLFFFATGDGQNDSCSSYRRNLEGRRCPSKRYLHRKFGSEAQRHGAR